MSTSAYPPAAPPPPRRAVSHQDDELVSDSPPSKRGPRAGLLLVGGVLAIVALAFVLVVVFSGEDKKTGDAPASGGTTGSAAAVGSGEHAISAALAGRTKAQFELISGAETITIRSDEIGSDLYRISTPNQSSLLPKATITGDSIQLSLENTGVAAPASAEVILSSKVVWQLKVATGGMKETINFGSGQLSGIELAAGAGEIDVTLPKAEGTLPFRLLGGAGQLRVHLPKNLPVQVKVGGAGVGVMTVDGVTKNNVKAGTELSPKDWATASHRYVVEAVAGVSTLSVDRK